MTVDEELDPETLWLTHSSNLAYGLAQHCVDYSDWPRSLARMNSSVNTLMTELWDRGFSQGEIRTAFTEALAEELVGTGLTATALCPGPTTSNFSKIARGPKRRRLKTVKMSSQTVASYGYRAFRAGKLVAVPGWSNRFLTFLIRIIPRRLVRKMAKFYNRTEE